MAIRSPFELDETIHIYPDGAQIIEREVMNAPKVWSKYQYIEETGLYYYDIPVAFDIEDTSMRLHMKGERNEEYFKGGRKVSTMYIWQVGVNGKVILGRTWNEFIELIRIFEKYTDINNRLIIYVHYLTHEFSFIQTFFNWHNVFCRNMRDPIYAVTESGIEFRDSYILTAKSLEKSAEDLQKYPIKKLKGDLDYTKIRGSKTPLTAQELAYCSHDVLTLNAIIREKMESEKRSIAGIPLTNTGYVRRFLLNKCRPRGNTHKKDRDQYARLMGQLTLDQHDYRFYKTAFSGGFTHANALYIGDHITGRIDSMDFTSSYPAVILSERFPMSAPDIIDHVSRETFIKLINDPTRLLIFDVELNNVRMKKDVFENPIAKSKCMMLSDDAVINNGRVVSATYMTTTITNIDYSYIVRFYDFDTIAIGQTYVFRADYLPKPIIEATLDLYKKKTTLKGVEGKEVEYMLFKGMLNSVYGCMVTDPVKDLITYDNIDGWQTEEVNIDEALEKYNNSKKRFLFYPWGVFVTSYARRNLMTGILAIGKDYIYSDTDSLKFLNYEDHKEYFEKYNYNIIKKINLTLDHYGIDRNEARPKTIKGAEKQIGIWDWETENEPYTDFKTLGSKRYIYTQSGKLHITIAGLSKSAGRDYIESQKNPYEYFNEDMSIDADHSGRLTHTYIDTERKGSFIDYMGIENDFDEKTSIHLEKSEFTLNITDQFINYVKGYKDEILHA